MLSIIKKECMLFDLQAADKREVIEKMVENFSEQGYLSDAKTFLQDVEDREKVFPTYIDYGIGLPHGKSDGTRQAGICIARLKNPVIWDEETKDIVDMVIMIAVKAGSDNNLHLQILAKLSRALMHEEFRNIIKNGDIDQVYEILTEQLDI